MAFHQDPRFWSLDNPEGEDFGRSLYPGVVPDMFSSPSRGPQFKAMMQAIVAFAQVWSRANGGKDFWTHRGEGNEVAREDQKRPLGYFKLQRVLAKAEAA